MKTITLITLLALAACGSDGQLLRSTTPADCPNGYTTTKAGEYANTEPNLVVECN